MKAEDYSRRKTELAGWPVNLTSYKVGDRYHCIIDNVDPGAWIARAEGATREEAEAKATEQAQASLSQTKRRKT